MGRTSTSWKPGQTGNPKGRPPVPDGEIAPYARQFGRAAIDTMVACLKDNRWKVPAAVALLDRGYGKPAQAIYGQLDANLSIGGIDRPPRETLEEWLARRRRELAALDGPHKPGNGANCAANGESRER